MEGDEDDLNQSDSIELMAIIEQQDDEKTTTTINNSSVDTIFSKETENLSPNRRRARVKFAYSFDDDQLLPIIQTTVIKTEPCFKVITTEDQVTTHFYQNISMKHEQTQFIEQKTSSERDSLEDEYPSQLIKERKITSKISDTKHPIPHRTSTSSPIKSILKKPKKKEEKTSIPKIDRSLKSRSPSPSSSKAKAISSTRLDFNEVQHLAEITAKQNLSSPSIHSHSLFDQTINIFDPNNSYRITSTTPRPSRLQYYIKPYRGEYKVSPNTNKQRSRSLPQRSERTTRRDTFSNQYVRPSTRHSNRKQHISCSPARDYIHHGRDHTIITPTRKKETSSGKISSSLLSINPSLSLSNSCLRNFSPVIPVFVRDQASRFPSPPLSTDSYHTPSIIDRPLTPLLPMPQYNYNKEEKENMLKSDSSDIIHQHKKEHDERMRRYDQLSEKLRATDEQLQSLSRSWKNSAQQRTPVKMDQESNLSLNKMTSGSHFFSPMILQICLIILVISNLLVVYFFNEINIWWSENIAPGMIVEEHNEDLLTF